jgi:hypothetical protein
VSADDLYLQLRPIELRAGVNEAITYLGLRQRIGYAAPVKPA